jgi:hypothetical protein
VGGEACTFQFSLRPAQDKTYHFNVIFAGDYKMRAEITVEGNGKSPPPAPSERTAPPQ